MTARTEFLRIDRTNALTIPHCDRTPSQCLKRIHGWCIRLLIYPRVLLSTPIEGIESTKHLSITGLFSYTFFGRLQFAYGWLVHGVNLLISFLLLCSRSYGFMGVMIK